MINKLTILNNTDTSNIGFIKVFHLYGGFYRKKTKIGFYIKGSIRLLKKKYMKNKVKKGKIVKMIICSQKFFIKSLDNSVISNYKNKGLYLKKKNLLNSNYIIGPGFKNLNNKKILNYFKNFL